MRAFREVKVIGKGSFGEAIMVQRHSDNAAFVVKKVPLSGLPEKERAEAANEVAVLDALQHPHIVRLHGVVTDEPKSLSLLMELSPIGSLRGLLDKTPAAVTSSEKAQLSILTGIALGMAYLHDQKPKPVLHHDLKSDNCLVWPDATCGFVAKITDFGLASGTQGSTMRTTRKQTGAATLAYKAPECFDDEPFTAASEVYAFGIIVWELLTAGRPWEGYLEAHLGMAVYGQSERPPLTDDQAATYIAPLNWGYSTFDNFAVAFLTVFQCITMEGWTEIMYQLMDGYSAVGAACFFSILVLFGSLFVLNLLLAVMEGNFRNQKGEPPSFAYPRPGLR